jgi:hypothetical protein
VEAQRSKGLKRAKKTRKGTGAIPELPILRNKMETPTGSTSLTRTMSWCLFKVHIILYLATDVS